MSCMQDMIVWWYPGGASNLLSSIPLIPGSFRKVSSGAWPWHILTAVQSKSSLIYWLSSLLPMSRLARTSWLKALLL